MRTRTPLAPPAIHHELARTAPREHPLPTRSSAAHPARTEDDPDWRDARSLLLPRHDCVAAEPMRRALAGLQLASVRDPNRATLDRCLVGAGSWFRVARASAEPGGFAGLAEWGRFRIGLPDESADRGPALIGWLPLLVDPDTAWIMSMLGRASWRAGPEHRAALERLVYWTLRRSALDTTDGPRALGADERSRLEPFDRGTDWCTWSPAAAAAMPGFEGVEAPRFVLGSLPSAATALRDWLRAHRLVD